jgi:hypothetical protein
VGGGWLYSGFEQVHGGCTWFWPSEAHCILPTVYTSLQDELRESDGIYWCSCCSPIPIPAPDQQREGQQPPTPKRVSAALTV